MNVLLFGATGMVGQGVLRECLLDPCIEHVLVIGRTSIGRQHPKLREILHQDFSDFSLLAPRLTGLDACFFCLGVTSFRMTEADYRRITYGFTLAAAETLVPLNTGMTFIYVSGSGTNPASKAMWARVKGETENALLRLPFRAAYMFRPGFIVPLHGIRSKTKAYQFFYTLLGPVFPLLRRLFPSQITTTEILGQAMIKAARTGAPKSILESPDINSLLL